MSALLAWYRGVKNGLVVPYLLGQYNVSSIKDLRTISNILKNAECEVTGDHELVMGNCTHSSLMRFSAQSICSGEWAL